MPTAKPSVFVVDDDESVVKSLARLLRAAGFEAVSFRSPHAFLDAYEPATPGCLVLDVAMPGLDGLKLQQALRKKGRPPPIIFLTGHGSIPMSVQAMKGGAVDFLTKPVNDADLISAVRRGLQADSAARAVQIELDSIHERFDTLTPREYEVMLHVIAGKRNKEVASELGTAEKTIKVHRSRVMEKMRVDSLADLVRLAGRAGIGSA